MGNIVKYRLPCTAPDSCGSSDAMVQYEDGGKYCHKCRGWDNSSKGSTTGYAEESAQVNEFSNKGEVDFSFYFEGEFKPIKDRRIDADTCKKFGVRTNDKGHHMFPRYNKEGELIGVKTRLYPDKNFRSVGDTKGSVPFGMQAFPKTGRSITITEGEYDAMAAYKMTGSKYPNVSIWDGAGSAKRCMKDNFEEFKEYESIVINFDADKPGREATQEIGPMFPGRTKIMELTEGKDACDYLAQNKTTKYVDEFHRSKRFTLGGIINGADTWDKYKEKKNIKSIPWDPQYVELNQKTYGMRLGEIVLITAGTGSGKTQVLREWKYHLLQNTDYNIMDISLEEDVGDTIGGLMAIHANKRITLPDVDISEQEERKLHSELYGTGKFTLLDHEGSVGDESLLDKMEYAATVDNCKIQFLDHITIAVSDCEGGQENVTMDKFMNRLLKMVKRLNICVVVVSHLRKVGGGGKSFEEGRVPTEDDLKGSGSLKQIAMTTIAIARNKYAETEVERNTTSFHVLKCRFSGRTGPADYSHFDDETGRMTVIDPEEAENADNQFKDSPVGGY
jgi:twinkle protein